MNHQGTKTIETDRLILRKFIPADVRPAFQNWCSDDQVTKFLTWPTHKDVAVTVMVINDWISRYSEKTFYQWAIVYKEINEPIGSISVVEMDEKSQKVHVGYCIGRKWWHQGITSEAFSAVIRFLFDEVKTNRIEARHDSNNPNSGKVMEKCGLEYEGTLRMADWNNQGIVDACMYGLLAEDYYRHIAR